MADARANLMRRRFGLALRTMRQRAGLNLSDAASQLGLYGAPTLSKIENGKQRVPASALGKYFEVYSVDDEERRDEIRKMASLASSGRRTNLLSQYRDAIRDPFADYLELEELASHADIYASQLVPGLLQTADYAHAVVEGSAKWSTAREVRTFVELRMKRQQVLRREDPLSLRCILDEAVLRRSVGGPEVLRAQVWHLLGVLDEMPHVHAHVLPFSTGAHTGTDGSYTVFRFGGADPLVVVEPMTTSLYLEEDVHVGRYDIAFDRLRARALDADASRVFLEKILEEDK